MPCMMKPAAIYFMDGPALEDLCSVTVKVPPLQNCSGSLYQPHIIRSRELIFTEPDIIASPLLDLDRHIQIIMQQSYYKTGRLQARFQKIGIEMQKPRRVVPQELQACMNYTIQAKLAPTWNKLGDLLVEGREFVSCADRTKAVSFELNVRDGQSYLALRGHNIRSTPVKLRDLDISSPLIHEFTNNQPHGHIDEYSIGRKWCHILPSMKKGQVVSVHQTIPTDSPFKSYKDMKRYWKNTYGYRLPESEDGILFCQVYFKLIGEKLFTYPHYCIRPYEPTFMSSGDGDAVISTFLRDLGTKLPSLCGRRLRVVSEAQYTQPQLRDVMELSVPDIVPNLSHETSAITSQRAPPTDSALIGKHATVTTGGHVVPVPASMRLDVLNSSCQSTRASAHTPAIVNEAVVPQKTTQHKPIPHAKYDQSHVPSSQAWTSTDQSEVSVRPRKIIPVFKSTKPKVAAPSFKPAPHKPRTVPIFIPGRRKPTATNSVMGSSFTQKPSTSANSLAGSESTQKPAVNNSSLLGSSFTQKASVANPLVSSKFMRKPTDSTMGSNTTNQLKQNKPWAQKSSGSTGHTMGSGNHSLAGSTGGHTPSHKYSVDSGYSSGYSSAYSSNPWATTPSKPFTSQIHMMSPSPRQVPGTPVLSDCRVGVSVPNTPEQYGTPSLPVSALKHRAGVVTPGKRPTNRGEETPKAKKPRAKPKVQEDVNVEQMAKTNQLSKVTTVTLMSWLRDQGVICKTKDKKTDLILRVQGLLGIG